MRLPRVHTGHPEVEWVQLTHHAVVRFRARRRVPRGMDAADMAAGALAGATVDRVPPSWAAGQEAEWFAVTGDTCFPLVRAPDAGVWITTTCLVRGA
ncbi:MAG: hypothetical protein WD844_10435 [Thermoleophilaceae bacterium]